MSEPERSMGVLLVTDALEPGGLERVVVELAAGLAEAGHAVGVHAAAGGGLWDRLPETVVRHPLDGTPTAGSIRALLRSGRYAVVHAHQRKVSMLARIAATGLGVPVVEHVHNVFRPSPIARLLSFRAPMLIACGTAVRTMLIDGFGRTYFEDKEHLFPAPRGQLPSIRTRSVFRRAWLS